MVLVDENRYMLFTNFVGRLWAVVQPASRKPRRRSNRRWSAAPAIEFLENRTLLSSATSLASDAGDAGLDQGPDVQTVPVASSRSTAAESTVYVLDDRNPACSVTGRWVLYPRAGYGGSLGFAEAGHGEKLASCTLSSLAEGDYRVTATWVAHANRASNAPYRLEVNGQTVLSGTINQRLAADDEVADGGSWETLGTVTVPAGGSLLMELSNAANGYVIADALRIVRVGSGGSSDEGSSGQDDQGAGGDVPSQPEPGTLTLSVSDTSVTENVGEGATSGTVTRSGADFSRSLAVSLSSSDQSEARLPAMVTIPAGAASVTFLIDAVDDTVTDGPQTVLLTATAGGYTAADANLSVEDDIHVPPRAVVILDNMNPNCGATEGDWTLYTAAGYGGSLGFAAQGGGEARGWCMASGLSGGDYVLSATWVPHANRATNVPFTVEVNGVEVAAGRFNQQVAPNDRWADGGMWEDLVTVSVPDNGSIRVEGSNDADGYVIADAVRFELPALPGTVVTPSLDLSLIQIEIGEADGQAATSGTVTRNGVDLSGPLTISLASSDMSEARVPSVLVIPAGESSVGFSVTAVNDNVADGTQWVTLKATAPGLEMGQISLPVNDDDMPPPQTEFILDDSDPSCSVTGVWYLIDGGFWGSFGITLPGNGSAVASCSVAGLPKGVYVASATWVPYSDLATNARFSIQVNGSGVAAGSLNQRSAPNDRWESGAMWEDLATFRVPESGTVRLAMTNQANGYVIADAARLEWLRY